MQETPLIIRPKRLLNACLAVNQENFQFLQPLHVFYEECVVNGTLDIAFYSQCMVWTHRRRPPILWLHNSIRLICCQTWHSRCTQGHTTSEAIALLSLPTVVEKIHIQCNSSRIQQGVQEWYSCEIMYCIAGKILPGKTFAKFFQVNFCHFLPLESMAKCEQIPTIWYVLLLVRYVWSNAYRVGVCALLYTCIRAVHDTSSS